MSRRFLTVLLLMLISAASTLANAQKPKKPAVQKEQKQAIQQETPPSTPTQSQPEPPATPEHGPSSPPDVIFKGGQLTITARNSTLGDVLNAVKQKTGASVDMPASSSERVVGQFGPGAPRDVMAQLLNGSHYDYVLMGSPADPGALNKIVLMARASGPEPAAPPQQSQPSAAGFQQGLQVVPQVQTDQAEDNAGEMPPDVAPPEEEQQQQEQPDQVEPPDQQEQAQPGQPGQPVVKTPEQLLRELQQQQQQQQQQNGQQPPQ